MTLEQLEQELAAMPDERVAARVNTLRLLQEEAAWEKRQALSRRIAIIRSATSTLAALGVETPPLEKWHNHLVEWRKTLCDQLLACPPRPRNSAELGIQQSLRLSIACIDRGLDWRNAVLPARLPLDDLMEHAGYAGRDTLARTCGEAWRGSLSDVERRLKELTKRRDAAQADLTEALLDDAERERLVAERRAKAEARPRKLNVSRHLLPDAATVAVATVAVAPVPDTTS